MARFWGEAAIEKGYLPEDSEFHIIGGSSSAGVEHAVCVFEAPEGDKYIIDGILYDSDGGGNPSRLLTLAEYREDRDKLDSFLRQALLFDEAQPEAVYPDTEGPLVTEEWMNQSSDTPIDDSISDNDLKEKIYNQYDVDPDPHATKSSSYKDYLVQYGEEEFWQEKFDDFADIPDALGADIGNAMTEGTLAWGFSLYKRNKILRRRKNIIKAFEVKQKWKNLRPQKQLMTLSDFKDFGSISHLVDTKPPRDTLLKVTADIFNCHKSYRNLQDFQNLIENLTWLFPEDQELRALRTRLTPENMENPNFIVNDLEKKLKEYGISVDYEKIGTVTQKIADKFRRMQNKKL
ncbi:MAG: hypothetical protein ACPG5T_10495, partial [Endozoicomonas sp.]